MPPEGTITDVPEMDIDATAELLLKKWTAKPETTDTETTEVKDVTDDTTETEVEDGEDEVVEGEEKIAKALAADDHEVEVTVDGVAQRVAVKDLKRLFGQEASLTRKSQEVAEARAQATALATQHSTKLADMLKRTEERYAPFAQVDWALAAAKLSDEDYTALKTQAQALHSDIQYLKSETAVVDKATQEARTAEHKAAVAQCVTALTTDDPANPHFIKGWNDEVYTSIRDYAVSMGVPRQAIDGVTDPSAIAMINKAMLYDRAQKTAVKKLAAAPKNVNKTPTNDGGSGASVTVRKAMDTLRASGSPEDAQAALLAKWAA